MDSALLSVLRVAGPAVLVVSAWAVWVRRATFGSRFDSGATVCIALFGLGALLDSPWSQIAAASYPLTGKNFVLNLIGNLCYISGGAVGVRAIYLRLLPDDQFDQLMRKWLTPAIIGVGSIMVGSFWASRVTSTAPAVHLYLVRPDGWLTAYYLALFTTTTLLGVVCGYGIYRLRQDPRGVLLNLTLAALALAGFGGVVMGWGVITGRIETLRLVAWLLVYTGFAAAAVGSAIRWRHRIRAIVRPPD